MTRQLATSSPSPAPDARAGTARRRRRRSLAALAGAATVLALAPVAPAAAEPATSREDVYVKRTMHRMTLEQKVGQMMTGYVYGTDASTPDPRNTALYGVATPAGVVEEFALGGVVHFAWTDSFSRGPEQLARLDNGLQDAALSSGRRVPLLVAADQEQGIVTRLGPPATAFPGSMALGAGRSAQDARTAAAITGEELRAVGITQDFAPVADVNVNPLNPVIGVRSFGSDAALVSEMVAAQVRGYQEDGGIAAAAKHFPGHGDTAVDSHVGLPVIDHTRQEWEEIDAPPFRAAVEAGVDVVMTAHIVVPSLDPSGDPATLSEPIMTGLLREEMGYDGVITTDSLEMEGVRTKYGDGEVAVRALEAGADVLLMPAQPRLAVDSVLGAVASGRLTEERLDESVDRILRLKWRRGVVAEPKVDPGAVAGVLGAPEHRAAAQEITDRTTTVLRDDDDLLPLAPAEEPRDVLVTGWGVATTAALGDAMAARGDAVTVRQTGVGTDAAVVAGAVAAAEGSDLVVVTTNGAWGAAATGQQRLVADLVATGVPVVHVAVRDPYDIAALPGVSTSLATYSSTPVSMESVARVVHGEVSPVGKLPVDVPVAGDPGSTLLPFGFGLTW
ncbi:glycoside hydrolase family 3 protein [uncultured Pseudokineococcus sp.]|uniref:glycoside hydrolase family 3 protein n=1 Tax=uncultured Pseudokineococcus sp. TaxID=1642928 RepID=UPI002626892E|nr:glycoside hydrolase family 3 protein [uncultured Pseudokineococcus sp.]